MFTKLIELYDAIDKTTAKIAHAHQEEFRCSPGCSDCCHAAFDVSLVEGYFILQNFRELPRKIRRIALKNAARAMREWNRMLADQTDIAKVRIRCPLLNENDRCMTYNARPVNCRTYGVPTEIAGTGHVCQHSGFQTGITYPTVRLDIIQKQLREISTSINREMGIKRWPVAAILLSEKS